MNIKLDKVNKLPVRTWSWLGVNDTSLLETVPDLKPYKKNPLKSDTAALDILSEDGGLADTKEFIALETGAGEEAVQFVRENSNAGISLRIQEGKQITEPVYLEYVLDDKDSTVVDHNRIIAEANSSITVVMVYRSLVECPVFHGGLTYLSAGKNAVINLIQIQLLSEKAVHLNNIGARLLKDGKINIIQAELGGLKAVNGIHSMLSGDNSGLDINTVFFGDKNRSIDFNYVADHTGKKTGSEINLNGALMDTSRKTFRGTIDFKKGAAGAAGHESEYTLLFGSGIKNVSAPLILCGEEDVEGKHAANSGKIDENKLFYMMSRGMDELSAKKLILEAWFEPVISKIPYNSLREDISEYLKERLSHVKSI